MYLYLYKIVMILQAERETTFIIKEWLGSSTP